MSEMLDSWESESARTATNGLGKRDAWKDHEDADLVHSDFTRPEHSMIEHRDFTKHPPVINTHASDQRCAECAPRSQETRLSNLSRPEREQRVADLQCWFQDQDAEFGGEPITPEVQRSWDNHTQELARHRAIPDQAATRDHRIRDVALNGGPRESGDSRRIDQDVTPNFAPTYDRARAVIENASGSGLLPDSAAHAGLLPRRSRHGC
jgi:hypothetical protein